MHADSKPPTAQNWLLDTPEATRTYFWQLNTILKQLCQITSQQISHGNTLDDQVTLDYLKRLKNSFIALSAKYQLNGQVNHRQTSHLLVNPTDSGQPVRQTLLEMELDYDNRAELVNKYPPIDELKQQLIDYCLQQKKISRDIQYEIAQQQYHQLLDSNTLFFSSNTPKLHQIASNEGEAANNQRYFMHWAVYDASKHIPNIYLLYFDTSSPLNLTEDDATWQKLIDHLLSQSLSTLKLVTIASELDKQFPLIHPKLLKRIHIGPLYLNNMTQHNQAVQDLFNHAPIDKRWLFAWSVESLFSKGISEVAKGFFGRQQKQVYHIDHHDFDAFEAGASAVEQSIILPYEAFQLLAEMPDNPLHDVNKYIVSADGHLIYM
ncbi:hypothetical protein H0A36_17045 [Endozoicomonas sp. SM1973]|uniref:Uncharacterized protein n=1 Tax=Spartinivicinus marinus TaxID=2994442 RepID=A0A853I7P5_9GAMM|nr:hypothetical protein [Spartinivicinus marinus]MCX4029102.1 hypothetical protein [Spartinivicinus marinus]NYZ67722.1 hypothetical protein [Spartinivicinus marinus]